MGRVVGLVLPDDLACRVYGMRVCRVRANDVERGKGSILLPQESVETPRQVVPRDLASRVYIRRFREE